MGRKTFESIGRPLPNRENIVITRRSDYHPEGVWAVSSLDAAIVHARAFGTDEIFVIGGAEIYKLALPYADRLYLTVIHREIQGDAYFPEFDRALFDQVEREYHSTPIPHSYLTLDRAPEAGKERGSEVPA
jgi:dihydrofolate reductase